MAATLLKNNAVTSSEPPNPTSFADYVGSVVVLDAAHGFVILGTLVLANDQYLTLENVDVHDLRETQTTRDLYILDSHHHGVRANRRKTTIRRDEILGMSLLEDVID